MTLIPGTQFNLTGASGTQGLLTPKASWRAYIFPRGAYASQSSTGAIITFDTVTGVSRFAVNNWIQVGLNTSTILQVAAVGGNSINVGSAVTVTEDDRIFLIGNTQPTVTGGSATYRTPLTAVYNRDDDGSDRYTNSMLTSNADGLIRFYAEPQTFDVMIQDGNQSNRGYIADLLVGTSNSERIIFGGTVSFATGISANSWLRVGSWLQVDGSTASFGGTVTIGANAGCTGSFHVGTSLTVGGTATFNARAAFGQSAVFNDSVGFTGIVTLSGGVTDSALFGSSVGTRGRVTIGQSVTILGQTSSLIAARLGFNQAAALIVSDLVLGASWGTAATHTVATGSNDTAGAFTVQTGTASFGVNPSVTLTHRRAHAANSVVFVTRAQAGILPEAQPTVQWSGYAISGTTTAFLLLGTPAAGQTFTCNYLIIDAGIA